MDNCPQCKEILLKGYRFCPKCGCPLTGESPAAVKSIKEQAADNSDVTENRDIALKFFNVAQNLTIAQDVDQLLPKIGQAVEEILQAERSSIMLLDETGKNLYFKTASGGDDILKKLKIPLGMGVAGWIAQNKKSDIVNDPYNDERFSRETDKKTGFTTKSIVGVPLLVGDELVGIAEAINKKDGKFSAKDLEILTGFAGLAAVSIVNTRMKTDQKNFLSNMLDFLVLGSEALGKPEPTPKGHTWEIARYAPQIGKFLNFSRAKLQLLNHAALVHDIGFLGLENPQLVGLDINKELSDEIKYRLHPVIGGEMVRGIKLMRRLAPFILYHHRYKNGTGFPENIPPEKITPEIEIISILEEHAALKDKSKIDPAKFSPEVYQAFIKVCQ
ncbi:GAF domain-containing protein [Elusimicrobiota bacterium]